ncbi:uncharacterized protein LOC128209708 [Mya arenaria]|uniref:uncharacterized protein LOC128209708 n=1 Tax=Mya arenaria TaxID=6604 RepID=UPI0022E272A2|nr:uncharacterized protein LOC128209708 [Mya arenaria]
MVNCLCIGIVFATIVPIVNTYQPCDDGLLNGIICTSGCCGDNDNPGFLKCCNRYAEEGFVLGDEDYPIVSPTLSPNPPLVIVPGKIAVIVLMVIILISVFCSKFCLKKLRKTEIPTDQLEQEPNGQQPNRSRPFQSLQTISGSVIRTNKGMQDPPPYEVLEAYYSNEPPIQVVNKPSIDVRNSIGKPPPYEIRRTACPNSPSLQAGNLAVINPLRNNTEEPPPYKKVVANYNHL